MLGMHDELNERLELRVVSNVVEEYTAELSGLLRTLRLSHLVPEVLAPLGASTTLRAALAYEERPWPPVGVGARSLSGMMLATLGDDGQALLTPALLSPESVSNVGLAAGLTKLLLEDLGDQGVEWVSLFVNDRSKVVAGELTEAGFERRQARVLMGKSQFTAFATSPSSALDRLGLADVRVGDVLALNLDRAKVARLTSFHLALASGVANYWADRPGFAEVFPGFVDWVSLPPGGITGTAGPTVDPMDPVVVLPVEHG
jgi:hypothetical protein